MSNALILCSSCARHVRSSEPKCPFCSASLTAAVAGAVQRAAPKMRLGRAATFAFGAAALTVSAAACGDDDAPGTDSGTPADLGGDVDLGNIAPMYGLPADLGMPVDGATEVDLGGVGPLYGLPPPDAGAAQDAGPDLGGVGVLYGLPPP